MRSIFTWGRIGAVSAAAIVLVLVLLYWLLARTSDSPALSATEATITAGEYMASEYGSSGCTFAEHDPSRDVWEVSCHRYDSDLCEGDAYTISCGPGARIGESILVDDQSAEAYEPR